MNVVVGPDELRLSVVVTVSPFDESMSNAVESIATCIRFVRDFHVVRPGGYASGDELWTQHMATLTKSGLDPSDIHVHSSGTLDPSLLKGRAVMELEPDVCVTEGAFETLLTDMVRYRNLSDHYAIASDLFIQSNAPFLTQVIPLIMYGYLVVIMALDTFRSFCNKFQYHRTVDVCVRFVYTTFPKQALIARHRWWTWFLYTGVRPVHPPHGRCTQAPPEADQGTNLLWRTIRNHRHLGFPGLWMIGFAVYYYVAMNSYAHVLLLVFRYDKAALAMDVWHSSWLAIHLVHFMIIAYISYVYLDFPYGALFFHLLFYPFYLATFPIIWLVMRFVPVRETRKSLSKKEK